MRIKIVIPLILTALVAVLFPLMIHHRAKATLSTPWISAETFVSDRGKSTPAQSKESKSVPQKKSAPEIQAASDASNNQDEEDYVDQRVSELHDLAMTDDPDSLATITLELDSREPQIRQAALAATIQFGSRDAIPALQNTLQHTGDPQEKINLQKAIDFLALPSMSEIANRNY